MFFVENRVDGDSRVAPAVVQSEMFAGHATTNGTPFVYKAEEEIFGEGEPAEFVYKVVAGAVRSYKLLADGRRQIGAFHLPGDFFGLESVGQHQLTAEAIVKTKVVLLKRSSLEALAVRDVAIAYALWITAAKNLRNAEGHMILLGRKTALERVATFLLDLDQRLNGGGKLDLPMSRRDIADYLGLTLETVSRAMSHLRHAGVLELSGARHVEIQRALLGQLLQD